MKSQTPPPRDTLLPSSPEIEPEDTANEEFDSLMVLIGRCVDALHLMQERMAGLEDHARRAGETAARNKAESRADVSALRTRLKLAETSVEQMSIRLSACEVGNVGANATQARELQAARSEAEIWKKRVDSDLSRINTLENRLLSMEAGLGRRLEQTEAELAAANSSVAQLRSRALDGEAMAADLERKLAAAGSAIADQRARIACLQVKLAAATDARRFAEPPGPHDVAFPAGVPDDEVMDLADLDEDRQFSAA